MIVGGARSGKSQLAEKLAKQTGFPVTYIATATAEDDEMAERIRQHQKRRPKHWQVIEESICLGSMINQLSGQNQCLLVDCITLWLCNILGHENTPLWYQEKQSFIDALKQYQGTLILVTNEVGSGVVPMGELSRRFCDEAGWMNQTLARHCDRVIQCIVGLPNVLKGTAITNQETT